MINLANQEAQSEEKFNWLCKANSKYEIGTVLLYAENKSTAPTMTDKMTTIKVDIFFILQS